MSDRIGAVILAAILVFQMQVLHLTILEEIVAFETSMNCSDSLWLGPWDILSCEI